MRRARDEGIQANLKLSRLEDPSRLAGSFIIDMILFDWKKNGKDPLS